ncbi:G2 and S phase-expressed protein 1 isoform X1 [Tiliqua scincoides]|uniref:G2 and S phase-expressed protein 1 isoform X1 n=1 Tax=Tiliqua scincoides TaxID=71010 RepID=UPI0034618B81
MEERKTSLPSEEKMSEVKLNECVKDDVPLLSDEKFDFNLSLSPASEQEDEVFIGPMGHKEKCIAVSLEACEAAEDKAPLSVEELTWSPLAGEKFVEIFKEAHLVALQLQSGSKTKREGAWLLDERKEEIVETFVQESKLKLKIFERGIDTEKKPQAVKRETYCVWESPLCQLPPSLQTPNSQLPVAGMDNLHSPQMPINASSPLATDRSTKIAVVPATQAHGDKNNTKMSRLQPMKTSRNGSHTAVEQTKRGRLPSPSSRKDLNSTGSSEDLLSDKSSITSHVGDSSFCSSSSVRVNRTLSTPSKVGIKMTQLKLPSNVRMQRDTSSSSSLSSMNSSLNSSQSISPKTGKAASVGPKASANSSRLSSGPSKISVVRPMRVSSVQASHSDMSGKQPTSASKGNASVNAPKCKTTFSAKSSELSLQKSLQKSILENRRSSTPTSKTMLPLSTKEVKSTGVSSENATAKVLQPIGLLSSVNIGSNVAFSSPTKQSEGETMSNSCSVVKSTSWTPASIKHSALPTRTGHRISGIPVTPKTLPRLMSSMDAMPARRACSVSSKKSLQISSKWTKENKTRFTSSSSSSAEGDLSWPQVVPLALDFSLEKTSLEKEQDWTAEQKPAEETQVKEGILIDTEINKMPAVNQECENKPLIDFFNTPEIIKVPPLKPTGQLIDLSSPLISLSPEGNKENLDSPLLKF